MKIRFHLSCDIVSKRWYLEAHDLQARRWFSIGEDLWSVQQTRLSQLGVSEAELEHLTILAARGKVSAWLEAIDLDAVALIDAGFLLQPTTAAVPRQMIHA